MTDEFTTVRSEGGLIPSDLLRRIVANDSDLGGLAPQDYVLPAADRLGEAAARAWARAKTYWAAFRSAVETLPPAESGVTETREIWLLPLLRELGYGRPDYHASAEVIGERRYPISHRAGPLPIHLETFRQSLDHPAAATAGARRLIPHAMLQEYLNVSDATYGLVSNGHLLRLLRDNASLTRQAYLEFDLEAMLEGGVYADFVLLYLILHHSRLPRDGAEASQCWLEQWRVKAESQGTRALGELRRGVEAAITALGTGFLVHPANDALRARLASEQVTIHGYYQQLLRLIYRLIFLFAAEERDLIFPPGVDPLDKQRYRAHYAASRLRDLARKYLTDNRHDDLWRGLRMTFQLLAGQRQGLGVPALGGGLFDRDSCPDLDAAFVRNDALAEAIRRLSWVRVGRATRRVSYRDMDAEELGGVYEGLLERQPQVLADSLHPRFELVGSGQRKQTGSYYTPTSLVQELIRSALEPVIADRLQAARTPDARRAALLDIAVCDPASGSGHFLLAAARRLAHELARLDAGDAEPGPEQRRAGLREVIRHCIYGVDVNPLAVDLCKLALWLEGHDPGRPLTFLDHRIKVGNSLIGTTPELVAAGIPDGAFEPVPGDDRKLASATKQRNKREREARTKEGEQQTTFLAGVIDVPQSWDAVRDALAAESLDIANLPDVVGGQVADQAARYAVYQDERVAPARAALDAWSAASFWPLRPDAEPPPTTANFRVPPGQPPLLTQAQREEVERLRLANSFFHWPLEFPEVFERGGFDCVLGNPPWEKVEMDEQEFFADRDAKIAALPGARRKEAIAGLSAVHPALWHEFQAATRSLGATALFVKESGRFPLTGMGRINLYALFAEHDFSILNPIVPPKNWTAG